MRFSTFVASAAYCSAASASYIGRRFDTSIKTIQQTDGLDLESPGHNGVNSPDGPSSPLFHDGGSAINAGNSSTNSTSASSGSVVLQPGYLIGIVCLVGIL